MEFLLRHRVLSTFLTFSNGVLLSAFCYSFLCRNNFQDFVLVLLFFFLTYLSLRMLNMKVSPNRKFQSTFRHFLSVVMMDWFGNFMTKRLLKEAKRVKEVQNKFLMDLIRSNENTVFGKDFKFSEIGSREDFVRCIPMARLSDREAYVQRIWNGEQRVLSSDPVVSLGVTSGTSGKCNLIPSTAQLSKNFVMYGVGPFYHAMVKAFPQCRQLQRNFKIMFAPKWRYADCGLRVGPNSSNPNDAKRILHMYTTPFSAYEILDEKELTYIHLLFALKDPTLGMIETNFISAVYNVIIALHDNWNDLISDIENGTLSEKLKIDASVRRKLEAEIKPDPQRAQALRLAYMQPRKGLLRRLWPDLHVILSVDSGAFDVYRRLVLENEAFGLRTYSPVYAATEGILGVNIWPLSEARNYLLLPRAMFYEFIPIEEAFEEHPQSLFMDQIKEGGVYELLITTVSGLYRHRIGDVVRVTHFEGQCPVIEFMYRIGTVMNVRGEKMSENYFYRCLLEVTEENGLEIIDYTCVESPLFEKAMSSLTSSFHFVFNRIVFL